MFIYIYSYIYNHIYIILFNTHMDSLFLISTFTYFFIYNVNLTRSKKEFFGKKTLFSIFIYICKYLFTVYIRMYFGMANKLQ